MRPILHLSLPVRDLTASKAFYLETLGCELAREAPGAIDVWFYGLQLTLHLRPEQVLPPERRGVRHFGVTLSAEDLAALVTRLEERAVEWLSPLRTDFAGELQEQTKAKLLDPSGNVIEIKSYADVSSAFVVPTE
jgi:extradiol dioxygenase family protein